MNDVTKPVPQPSALTQPYWDGAAAGVLRVQRCSGCGKLRHYPRHICDACHSFDHDWQDCGDAGVVHSWTIAHHPFHPAFKPDLPYALVVVEMAEGVRVLGRFSQADGAGLRIGLPVRLGFEQADGYALPRFTPA